MECIPKFHNLFIYKSRRFTKPAEREERDLQNLRSGVGINGGTRLRIFNNLGVMMRDEDLLIRENKATVRINELVAGSYILELLAKESSYRSKMVVD